MSNRYRYTDAQKQQILDHLRANQGDVLRTATETGVNERTLLRWRREAGIEPPAWTPPLQPSSARERGLGGEVPTTTTTTTQPTAHYLNDDAILDALRESQAQMLVLMQKLLNTIPQAIDVAPLNQQVAALAQLTDRVIRLAAQLPPKDKDETDDRPLSAIFPPELLEMLDTRPDHTPSESDPDPAE